MAIIISKTKIEDLVQDVKNLKKARILFSWMVEEKILMADYKMMKESYNQLC